MICQLEYICIPVYEFRAAADAHAPWPLLCIHPSSTPQQTERSYLSDGSTSLPFFMSMCPLVWAFLIIRQHPALNECMYVWYVMCSLGWGQTMPLSIYNNYITC